MGIYKVGLNSYMDAALHYGAGNGLRRLGLPLGENPQDFSVSFKVGHILTPADPDSPVNACGFSGGGNYKRHFDYTAHGAEKAFEQSIEFLNAGRKEAGLEMLVPGHNLKIAAVFVHDVDLADHKKPEVVEHHLTTALSPQGAMAYLKTLYESGIIGGYGFAVKDINPIRRALEKGMGTVHMSAGRFTLLQNGAPHMPEEMTAIQDNASQVIMDAVQSGVRIIVASAGNSGLAFGGGRYEHAPASRAVLAYRDAFFCIT